MPKAGCRRLAITFNHLHQRRHMTVGKSFVANVLRGAQREVLRARRDIRRREPRMAPRNLIWPLDLTAVTNEPSPILGILDHGSRACLDLEILPSKRSVTLLRALLETMERFGKPRIVRTDNEPVFTSGLFSWALALLGIRHHRTAPFAPWQNGRIERFFGTFKRALRSRPQLGEDGLVDQLDLAEFRVWYNHLRPHQNLEGLTPAEAWRGKENNRRRTARWVSAWSGALSGFYWPSG
ncbi:MAG: integrase core domain-containing protein [Acidobacteriota bacterium]|nr:integrase core domain-containing protein [Acidobacteriota bacterium]